MKINTSILTNSKMTVGFSGGRDSVALLHWLKKHGYNVEAVHVNHNINPKSGAWAHFCQTFCDSHDIPIIIESGNVSDFGSNMENAARELRHSVFSTIDGPIILAHHAKDQEETFFFKLFRGAGIEGLTCMKIDQSINGKTILRPMLSVSRKDINDYVMEHGLGWVEDPSNADSTYDRNFIRTKLIPLILERFPTFSQNLARVMDSLSEAQDLLGDLAKIDQGYVLTNDRHWDIRKLNELHDHRLKNLMKWQLRMFGEFTYSHTTLTEFIRIVRNCNPNAKSRIVFGKTVLTQRGFNLTLTY